MSPELVQVKCPNCKGTGCVYIESLIPQRCKTCGALGHVCDWEPDEEVAA